MKKFIGFIIIVIVVILLFLLFNKNKSNDLLGSWVSEGGTIYEFNKNGKGVMIVPLSEYVFKYKIKDNILNIDYVDDKASDTKYTYVVKKDKLTLKGEKGKFTFTKKKKK